MERSGRQGYVSMDCTITRDGSTRDCVVTQATNQDFAQAAETYVAGARYRPVMRDGMPVEVPHHVMDFNFSLPANMIRLVYDCSITAAGQARNCRDRTSSGTIPPTLEALVVEKLEALSIMVRGAAGVAVEEPHHRIDVVLTLQRDPIRNAWVPTLPAQLQVNILLDCNDRNTPQCREIAEPPPFEDMPAHGRDEITGIAIGFDGVLPSQTAAAR